MMQFRLQHQSAVMALLCITAVLAGCGRGGPPAQPPPGVSVAAVVKKSVTHWDDFSGRIEAIESVELRPRVSGYLTGIHFREGGEVHKGDLLFTIDDREYKAAVDSARAKLASAETHVTVTGTEFARSEKLAAIKATSVEDLEQRRGDALQAKADRDSAAAQLRQSELNLEFTRITAPISGRISLAEVRPGNLVTAGTTLLSVLVSVDPVYVTFDGDERIYLLYQQLAREGVRPSSRDQKNPVRVGLASEQGYPHDGEMVFVDNQLNAATGTIRARALLSNKERVFTPGLFARVQLIGDTTQNALLIHDKAVLTDQDRKYVYVLGPNNTSLRKDVKLGPEIDGLRVVTEGLSEGDMVVVNGTGRILAEKQPLDPSTVPMDKPEMQPPPKAAAANAAPTGK